MVVYPAELPYNTFGKTIFDLESFKEFRESEVQEILYKTFNDTVVLSVKNTFGTQWYLIRKELFDIFLMHQIPNNQCPICDKYSYIRNYVGNKILKIACCVD